MDPQALHRRVRELSSLTIAELSDIGVRVNRSQLAATLQLLGPGTLREVGTELGISYHTIHSYSKIAYKAFRVRNRDELRSLLFKFRGTESLESHDLTERLTIRNRELRERVHELEVENRKLEQRIKVLLATRRRS